ncbi:MAG: hypothetical protein ABFD29_11340 [Anaerolineaceae bacterium]
MKETKKMVAYPAAIFYILEVDMSYLTGAFEWTSKFFQSPPHI